MVAALHRDWKETLANETFVCYRKNDVKRSEFLEESSLCFCLVMESYKSRKRRHFRKLLILFIADSSPDAISHGSLFRREKKNGGCLKALWHLYYRFTTKLNYKFNFVFGLHLLSSLIDQSCQRSVFPLNFCFKDSAFGFINLLFSSLLHLFLFFSYFLPSYGGLLWWSFPNFLSNLHMIKCSDFSYTACWIFS